MFSLMIWDLFFRYLNTRTIDRFYTGMKYTNGVFLAVNQTRNVSRLLIVRRFILHFNESANLAPRFSLNYFSFNKKQIKLSSCDCDIQTRGDIDKNLQGLLHITSLTSDTVERLTIFYEYHGTKTDKLTNK